MSPLSARQQEVRELCDAGRLRRAYEVAQGLGPLHTWRGTAARLLAADLAAELGGLRLAAALRLRAVRADPRSSEARCAAAGVLLRRQGPALAWARMTTWGEPEAAAPASVRAHWLILQATVAGVFRDFERAAAALRRAERLAPGDPWTSVAHVWLLEEQDQCAEALELARRALRDKPAFRPGALAVAHLLQVLGRADEARLTLSEAASATESGAVLAALASLLADERRFAESLDCLDRFEAHSPLLDRDGRRWLASLRSDALYGRGDLEGARAQAALAASPFHAALADRLARPAEDTRRVLLAVPFVRQHHKTCTPASLASVASFWSRPIDHGALAETICYDGTPRHRARAWAEANGWVVREFRVTWASACSLLDRGMPFVLALVGPMSGHDQAVVGYDARRGSFHVREPSTPFLAEALAGPLLESQRWSGPRGFVLVPREERERLAGVELPDAEAYDRLHRIQMLLDAHRREAAEAVRREMERELPDHPLTLWAAALTAGYDADDATQVQSMEGLLQAFPDSAALLFRRIALLQGVAPPGERRRLLEEACARHPRDAPLLSHLAHVLSLDAREHPRALGALRAVLRAGPSPTTAADLVSLARIEAARGREDAALELHRFAACLEDMNEAFAGMYFGAARSRDRSAEALAFLRRRCERLASRSGYPAATLSWALEQCGHVPNALDTLKRAVARRPADGELMLLAADAHARYDRLDAADPLLRDAWGRSPVEAWLRTAARGAFARLRRAEEDASPPRPASTSPGSWPAPFVPLVFVVLFQLVSNHLRALDDSFGRLARTLLPLAPTVLLVAVASAVWLLWRRRRASPPRRDLEPPGGSGGERPARDGSPSRVGRYLIQGPLARGGGLAVYQGRDETWERDVAVKVALDPAASARLLHEATVASRLHHPHIEAVYDVGTFEGSTYVACEPLPEGLLLAQLGRVRVGLHAAVAIVAQLLDGLHHAHERGVLHLALNPENVFVGGDGSVKILGFGLVRGGDPPPPAPELAACRSPEQARGLDVDGRSDLFSAGVVLRELVTEAGDSGGGDSRTPARDARPPGSPRSELPRGAQWDRLRAVLARALRVEPAERYPDAPAMSAALLEVLDVTEGARGRGAPGGC